MNHRRSFGRHYALVSIKSSNILHEHIILYAALTALTALSIDAVLPALRAIETELRPTPPLSAQHIVSLFILGMVFGELLFGPLSDAIGRKRALIGGLLIYMAGTLIAIMSDTAGMIIIGRMLQGFGVSGPKIATRALIRDRFEGDAMARVLSFIFVLIILVPMVAPLLGQVVLMYFNWRGVFVTYLAMAFVLCFWFSVRQPETLSPQDRLALHPAKLLRNALRILSNRRVMFLIIATGFIFGAQLLYLSVAADIFDNVYGIREAFPVYFAALAIGIGLASFVNAQLVHRFGMARMVGIALTGFLVFGCLMFGASLLFHGKPPLVVFMSLGFSIFFCIGILFGNLNAMTMQSLGRLAGLGSSLIASGSSLVAVLFAVALGSFYNQTVLPLSAGFALAGAAALRLTTLSSRSEATPIEPVI